MLNRKQKEATAYELQKNYNQLPLNKTQILYDLQFQKNQLDHALHVDEKTNGYDVWKLRDYLEDKVKEFELAFYEFSILNENIWYHYDKTW